MSTTLEKTRSVKFNTQLAKHHAGNMQPKNGQHFQESTSKIFLFSVSMLEICWCIQLSNPTTVKMTAINPGADVVDFFFVVLNQKKHSQSMEHSKWWA